MKANERSESQMKSFFKEYRVKKKKRKREYMADKRKKYIYNPKKANQIIQQGIRCVETGLNAKEQRCFWVFDYNEIQSFYESDFYKRENAEYIKNQVR